MDRRNPCEMCQDSEHERDEAQAELRAMKETAQAVVAAYRAGAVHTLAQQIDELELELK